MKDILKRWFEHVESIQLGVIHSPSVNCDFYGGGHFNNNCHLYSMENSWWEQELHLYNQLLVIYVSIMLLYYRAEWVFY